MTDPLGEQTVHLARDGIPLNPDCDTETEPWSDNPDEVTCPECKPAPTVMCEACETDEIEPDPDGKCPVCQWVIGTPWNKDTAPKWLQDMSKCPDCNRKMGTKNPKTCPNPDCESEVVEHQGVRIWTNPNWG